MKVYVLYSPQVCGKHGPVLGAYPTEEQALTEAKEMATYYSESYWTPKPIEDNADGLGYTVADITWYVAELEVPLT